MRLGLALVGMLAATASAGPPPPPPAPAAWIGVFRPNPPGFTACADCAPPAIVATAGEVIVLSPGGGSPLPDGDVTLVQPLTGMNLVAHVTPHGRAPVALFAADRRDGADAVLVLPGTPNVALVAIEARDLAAIRAALVRDPVFAGVHRALAGLEIGGVDVDGDRRADYAVTYGCNAWADGACQSKGEFLLARRGEVWRELQ